MDLKTLKEKIFDEIEMQLQHLGNESTDSVFPNFDLDSHELSYGIQRLDGDLIIETKARTSKGILLFARVKIDVIEE